MGRVVVSLLLSLALFGCLSNAPTAPSAGDAATVSPAVIDKFPVALDHDHNNPALHKAAWNVDVVGRAVAGSGRTPNQPVFNIALAKDTLVASLAGTATGGALAPPMSLLVANVKDPAKPTVLSVTPMPGGGVESVAISPEARYAFLGTEFTGAIGIWTFDLADPARPLPIAYTPQPTDGPHNLRYGVIGTRHFLFASVSHVGTGQPPLPAQARMLDLRVDLYEFTPAQPRTPLRLVSSYAASDQAGVPGAAIIHDAVLQVHPITGQPLLYVAHWARGLRIVDLTRPESPKEIGKYVDAAPTDFLTIHTAKPHPTLIDGRHVTVATAQCAYTPNSKCYVRVLDTTDPTNPVQVGTWTLPEEVHGGMYTTEIFDLGNGTLWVPWAHAGVWVLDIRNITRGEPPATIGYYFPSDAASSGGTRVPSANAIVLKDGHAILADVNTGLHVLALDAGGADAAR